MSATALVAGVRVGVRARMKASYWQGVRLRRRLQRALHGSAVSLISSNCVGERISLLAGNAYRSPTVNLAFDPDSYLAFVEDLPHYLEHEIAEDGEASEQLGYPVGRMGPVAIRFMHYETFTEAAVKWRARAQRVDLSNIALTFTDNDDATEEHVARFAALPFARKVMFTARPFPAFDCVVQVPARAGEPDVGDLYTEWHRLEPVMKAPLIDQFR